MEALAQQAVATLLISLRIAPTLAFAQPFTLMSIPTTIRVMLGIALAAWLVGGNPDATWRALDGDTGLPVVAASEAMLGLTLALTLQLAFAAILTAGRVIDIQAGFGLAVLVDPTTKAQMPLVGTVLVYAAGAIFFATDGPQSLLAIWAASLERAPLGTVTTGSGPAVLIGYCSAVFLLAIGLVGIVMLVLFLLDLAIAFLSRTLPQMNVLLLGFQVKTIAMLAMLPVALGLSGSVYVAMLRYALETMPQAI